MGTRRRQPGIPCAGTGVGPIQLVYRNHFPSIWEYSSSIQADSIDFSAYVGPVCPICQGQCDYREIAPYHRGVIELFPVYRTAQVLIARFQCRTTQTTFSLLPHQLAPYHRYTIDSMVISLVLACRLMHELGSVRLEAVLDQLPADCDVTTWLLRCWLQTIGVGLRRAHPVLRHRYDLTALRSGSCFAEQLLEIHQYFQALGIRGPPCIEGVDSVLMHYSLQTGRFLVGVSSQERSYQCVY